jgi:hypothetical protein
MSRRIGLSRTIATPRAAFVVVAGVDEVVVDRARLLADEELLAATARRLDRDLDRLAAEHRRVRDLPRLPAHLARHDIVHGQRVILQPTGARAPRGARTEPADARLRLRGGQLWVRGHDALDGGHLARRLVTDAAVRPV